MPNHIIVTNTLMSNQSEVNNLQRINTTGIFSCIKQTSNIIDDFLKISDSNINKNSVDDETDKIDKEKNNINTFNAYYKKCLIEIKKLKDDLIKNIEHPKANELSKLSQDRLEKQKHECTKEILQLSDYSIEILNHIFNCYFLAVDKHKNSNEKTFTLEEITKKSISVLQSHTKKQKIKMANLQWDNNS